MEKIYCKKNKFPVFLNVMKYMSNIFIWPEQGQTFPWKNWKKIVSTLFVIFTPVAMGLMGHIYVSLKGLLIADLVNDILYTLLFTIYASSGSLYIVCCKKLGDTVSNINNPKYGKSKNFTKLTERIEFLTVFIHHYVFCIATSYVLLFLVSDTGCKSKKVPEIAHSIGYICGVPTPAWFPLDSDFLPWKYFLIFCNVIILIYILPNGASICILYYGFIVFTVDRIDHLIFFLKKIIPQTETQKQRQQLVFCIKYYTEITLLVNDITDTIGVIFAPTQNGLIGILIAVLEYQALLERSAVAFFALTIWLLLEAVACYCGQMLEDAGSRLREQVYDMHWYRMEISLQKDFKMFHAQIQRGLHLKMKPSIHMNMEHFHKVMNGSYSFLMFLTNLESRSTGK